MNVPTDNQGVSSAENAQALEENEAHEQQQQAQERPRKRFAKTRKVTRTILAIDAWQRQFGHLKHRASFPLLRQMLRREKQEAETYYDLASIDTTILQRSLLSHCMILLFTVPACLWASYSTTKGLAAGIRFDAWFNGWLLQGAPVFIFCLMKALTSNHSRALIQRELAKRQPTPIQESKA